MKLNEIIKKAELEILTNIEERDVKGVFISDMLSDVMTNAKVENIWLTTQTHTNIVSAANLIDISAIIVTLGKKVPEKTVELANRYHVVVLSTPKSSFELARKLIEIGLEA